MATHLLHQQQADVAKAMASVSPFNRPHGSKGLPIIAKPATPLSSVRKEEEVAAASCYGFTLRLPFDNAKHHSLHEHISYRHIRLCAWTLHYQPLSQLGLDL